VGEYDKDRRTAAGGVVRGVLVQKSEGDIRCVNGVVVLPLSPLLGLPEDTEVGDGVCGEKEPFSTRCAKFLVLILVCVCTIRMRVQCCSANL
jgi:hypothetical protein